MQKTLEQILISSYKEEMISFMHTHQEVYDEAVELAVGDNQPFSWRAAWLLWSCMENNDKHIQKHIKTILKSIPAKKDGHQRELIKILSRMKLKDEQEGILFNICMNIWEGIHKNPSVRVTAFKFIVKLAKKHSELKNEITFLTQDHYMDTLSPGVKNSVSKMLNELCL